MNKKTLILYTFYDKSFEVEFFIKKGCFNHPDYKFIIISNNKNTNLKVPSFVELIKRENRGLDFGAWEEVLLTNNLYKGYDYFIFINNSCVGPFVPSYHKGYWCDIFNDNITGDIKLFGTTINPIHIPAQQAHVQSWCFNTDRTGLDILIKAAIFSSTSNWVVEGLVKPSHHGESFSKGKIIQKEIKMSREIIDAGWNIGCLLDYYKGIDFRFKEKRPEEYDIDWNIGRDGDLAWRNHYMGMNMHPYEVIFIKSNRDIHIPLTLLPISER
jgi:hypothetical protein